MIPTALLAQRDFMRFWWARLANTGASQMLLAEGPEGDRRQRGLRHRLPRGPHAVGARRLQLGALAVQLLNQAIAKLAADKQPGDPSYFFHLGLALAQTGDNAGAKQALERALLLKADFDGANEARALSAVQSVIAAA